MRVPRVLHLVDDEVSFRAMLRSLPHVSLWMLAVSSGVWFALHRKDPGTAPWWVVPVLWAALTVCVGPVFWARFLSRRTVGRLRAVLWCGAWAVVSSCVGGVVVLGTWQAVAH